MTRPLRIEYPGAWYHITCRGNGRAEIFVDDKDREKFLEILKESGEQYKVEVHCYALMSNHFHFLLHTPEGGLKRFMQRFNTAYTIYFNRKHRRCGHVLQGRYKGLLVEADEYLLELSRYIHLNPVRIKKQESHGEEKKKEYLRKYRWSSFLGYIDKRLRENYVHYDTVLGYMGADNEKTRKRYEEFVYDGIREDLSGVYDGVKGQVVLGGEGFLKWVQEQFLEGKQIKEKDIVKIRELKRALPLREITRLVAMEYGVSEEELLKKRSQHRQARQVLIEMIYQNNAGKKSLRELGRELGGIGGDGVLQTHKRVQLKLLTDKALNHKLVAIKKRLSSQ